MANKIYTAQEFESNMKNPDHLRKLIKWLHEMKDMHPEANNKWNRGLRVMNRRLQEIS